MCRPNKPGYRCTVTDRSNLAPVTLGPLPICNNPRFVERVIVPTLPEPRKHCRQCHKRRAGEAFAASGRGYTLDGHPLRKNVCLECESNGKGGLS